MPDGRFRKQKNTIYPQYKDLKIAKKEVVKAAPKGSAYEDLQEMVGMTEAKAVIAEELCKIAELMGKSKGVHFDAITTEEITTIKAVDITPPPEVKKEVKRTIGFAY